MTSILGGDDKGNWIGSSPSAVTFVCIRPQTVRYPDLGKGKRMNSGFPSLYSLERAQFIVRWWGHLAEPADFSKVRENSPGHGGFNLWGRLEKGIDTERERLGEV